ncbi:nucleotidyltransferase domain-containing protein [Gemmatimonadota bacterium]
MIVPIMGCNVPYMGIPLSPHEMAKRPLGLADALFGQVRQRVLGLLFGQPDRSFYAKEIIGWVDAGSGAVQRELARLETVGLVTTTRIGRQKHYQANPRAPIFSEVRGLVLKTSGLRDVLHDALSPFQSDLHAAFVFGSIAKGSDAAGSDVDLLLISDELTYGELFTALETAASRLARTVNPTIYASAEFARQIGERNPFLTKVLEQPKIWIIGEDDDLPT